MKRGRGRGLVAIAAISSLTAAAIASAQRLDTRIPQTLIVGPPSGPSPTLRGDAARRGRAPHVPASPRVAWRKELGQATPVAPLARANGNAIVLTAKAELVELDALGAEQTRFRLSSDAPSSASLLSDDALLVATVNRELVLVRGGALVRIYRMGRERDGGAQGEPDRANVTSVLPLDDGGAIVAFDDEIVAVDRDARIRARAVLPAPIRGALVAGREAVLATLATGSVVAWAPGAEVRRLGRMAGPVIGPAMRSANDSLVAVLDGPSLMRFDLARATATLLVAPPSGTALGVPSSWGTSLVLLAWSAGRTSMLELDADGRETRRVQVALGSVTDAGAIAVALSDVLVDDEGRVAFVSPDGATGVVDRDGTVRTLGETPCLKGRRAAGPTPPVGLVASTRGFLIGCDNGTVLSIED